MKQIPFESVAPVNSLIERLIEGADFHDAWSIESTEADLPALGHFLAAAERAPRWVDACMSLRNRAVSLVGLKDLGTLSGVQKGKLPADYKPGDRVGIFTLFENTSDEALLGDKDKHLNVVLSVHRARRPEARTVTVTVTTVVHVKNTLGRIYMLPVKPMHRLIAPAVLGAIGNARNAA